MGYSNINKTNKKTGLVVGQVIIALYMIFNVYLLLTKAEWGPKLLAGVSFILFLGLFIFGFKRISHLRE